MLLTVVELQLENTVLDFPLSDRDTVNEAEQSEGRDKRGKMSSTRLVWPGDTRHLHSAPVWNMKNLLIFWTLEGEEKEN